MEELLLEIIESAKVEALDELERDLEEVDVITDHLPEPEKCCTICEFSEPGDGCGANDLSESEFWEMKAEVHYGV